MKEEYAEKELIFASAWHLYEPFPEGCLGWTKEARVSWVNEYKCEMIEDWYPQNVLDLIESMARAITREYVTGKETQNTGENK